MDPSLLPLFCLTIILIIVDAAVGYHLAPLLLGGLTDIASPSGKTIRIMLAALVAIYTLLACLAWRRESLPLLLLVAGLVILDIIGQLIMRRRKRGSPPGGDS